MHSLLRNMAFLAGVCVLYVVGYAALAMTPPPWGLLWLPPLAVVGGAAWHLVERWDAQYARRAREHGERG